MMLPRIDVLIPFHKLDEHLLDAIASCQKSIGVNLRIICINDSGDVIKHSQLGLGDNDLLICTNGKNGYREAINLGIQASTATYVGFLDSDDLTSNDRYARQVNALLSNDLEISTCRVVKMSNAGRELNEFFSLPKPPQFASAELSILFGAYGSDSTLVCSGDFIRSTWEIHRYFPAHLADYGWLMRASLGKKIHFESSVKYYYRMHEGQMSRNTNTVEDWKALYPYWKEWLKNLNQLPKTSQLEISSNVALLLAFPSTLIKLTKAEKNELVRFCKSFQIEARTDDRNSQKAWKDLIDLRLLIGTRSIRYAKPCLLIKITVRALTSISTSNSFRKSTND